MQEVGLRISLALGSCALPESSAQALPVGGGAPKRMWEPLGSGSPVMTCRTKRNWESKHLAKIARWLEGKVASIKAIQLPDMRNVVPQLVRDASLLVLRRPVTVSLKEVTLPSGVSEPADWKL
jgi:hypothetical protein